jgi:ADP-heptose:LPS heptosyltransferase
MVAICPGGAALPDNNGLARRWKPERFAELVGYLSKRYNSKVLLLGTAEERPICESIRQADESGAVNLAGLTTIKTLAAIIEKCRLIITNDSLPLHLAVAFKTASISLFGPTDGRYKIGKDAKKHFFIQSPLSCSPCWHNENRMPACNKPKCMDQMKVNDVISLIEENKLLS